MLVKKSVFDGDDTNREDIYEGNDVEEVRQKSNTCALCSIHADVKFRRRRRRTSCSVLTMRKAIKKKMILKMPLVCED